MVNGVFEALFRMSLVGTVVGILMLLLKALLQKAGIPRTVLIWLWLVVVFRLLCPVSADSPMSVFNAVEKQSVITLVMQPTEKSIALAIETENKAAKADMLTLLWGSGALLMLGKGAWDYVRLKRKLRFAVKKDGYYVSEIPISFVIGIIKPKIYIPHGEDEVFIPHILRHEQMHIRRRDYLFKLLAYFILSVHWFNPAVWIFYYLYETDMEQVCDACVTDSLSEGETKSYLLALVSGADKKRSVKATPVCFGSCSVKKRVQALLKKQRAGKFLTASGVVAVLLICVVLGTNALPAKTQIPEIEKNLQQDEKSKVSNAKTEESVESPAYPEPAETESAQVSEEETIALPTETTQAVNPLPQENEIVSEPVGRTATLSYKDNCESVMEEIQPSESGEITMQFLLNAEQLVHIRFYESETGAEVEGMSVVAKEGTEYVFSGFEADKVYDVAVDGYTDATWMVEGTYTVY